MKKRFYVIENSSKPSGYSGESLNAEYDMSNACRNCGTGYKLIGKLPIKAVKLEKDFIQTLDGDYLISAALYSALKANDVMIGELLPVVDSKTQRELPYYHFQSSYSFPKMLPESEGIITDEQCPVCKRNGYFGEVLFSKDANNEITAGTTVPEKYKYRIESADFLDKSDIYSTWEHFGYSSMKNDGKYVIRYARPRLIISEAVKDVFESQKVKNTRFKEVYFN